MAQWPNDTGVAEFAQTTNFIHLELLIYFSAWWQNIGKNKSIKICKLPYILQSALSLTQHSVQTSFYSPLSHYSQLIHSVDRAWAPSTVPATLSHPSICSLLSPVIPLLSPSPLKQQPSISLSHLAVSLPSHPVVWNLQFILCPLILPLLPTSPVLPSTRPSIHLAVKVHVHERKRGG